MVKCQFGAWFKDSVMNMKKDVKFKVKPAFAFLALCPFVVFGFLAACANAENPQNLKKLNFAEVQNTAENLLKYPFINATFADIKTKAYPPGSGPTMGSDKGGRFG
jgi:hypothetical protein